MLEHYQRHTTLYKSSDNTSSYPPDYYHHYSDTVY